MVAILLLSACSGEMPEVAPDFAPPTVAAGVDADAARDDLLALELPAEVRTAVVRDDLVLAFHLELFCDSLGESAYAFGDEAALYAAPFEEFDDYESYASVLLEHGCPELIDRVDDGMRELRASLEAIAPPVDEAIADRVRRDAAAAGLADLLPTAELPFRFLARLPCSGPPESLVAKAKVKAGTEGAAEMLELFAVLAEVVCAERGPVVEEAIRLLADEGG